MQVCKPAGICRLCYLVGVVVRVFCCACVGGHICGHVLLHHHASLRDGFFLVYTVYIALVSFCFM